MVVVARRVFEELHNGLSCFGVLDGENVIHCGYVQKRLNDFAERPPARTIGDEEDVSIIRTDKSVANIIIRAAGVNRSLLVKESFKRCISIFGTWEIQMYSLTL